MQSSQAYHSSCFSSCALPTCRRRMLWHTIFSSSDIQSSQAYNSSCFSSCALPPCRRRRCSDIQSSQALTYNLLKRITARALARVHCPRASGGCSGIQFSQALTYNLLKRTASASARVQCPRAGGGCSEARGCGSQRIHRHFECVQEPQSHVACESVGRS